MKKIILLLLPIIFFSHCATCKKNMEKENSNIIERSNNTAFNYEYEARDLTSISIDTHFKIRIELEKPYVIVSPGKIEIDEIYKLADISGTTIFKVDIDGTGLIRSYKVIKSSGLGIDEILEKIVQNMKFSPLYIKGKSQKSTIEISIEIIGKDKI